MLLSLIMLSMSLPLNEVYVVYNHLLLSLLIVLSEQFDNLTKNK